MAYFDCIKRNNYCKCLECRQEVGFLKLQRTFNVGLEFWLLSFSSFFYSKFCVVRVFCLFVCSLSTPFNSRFADINLLYANLRLAIRGPRQECKSYCTAELEIPCVDTVMQLHRWLKFLGNASLKIRNCPVSLARIPQRAGANSRIRSLETSYVEPETAVVLSKGDEDSCRRKTCRIAKKTSHSEACSHSKAWIHF